MEHEYFSRQEPEQVQRLQDLTDRAKAGDESVLPELRDRLRNSPEVWQYLGDIAAHTERAWIIAIAADNLCIREGLEMQLSDLREQFLAEGDSCTEQMLVQRILNSWLQVTYYELAVGSSTGKLLKTHEDILQRRLDGAHRRHGFALRTLNEVRTLIKVKKKKLKEVDSVRVRTDYNAAGESR